MLRRKGVDRDEFPKADNSLSKMHDLVGYVKYMLKPLKVSLKTAWKVYSFMFTVYI